MLLSLTACGGGGGEATPEETDPDGEPEWAKKLREQNEALQARLDKADKEANRKRLLSEIVAESKKKLNHDKAFRLTEREFALGDDETKEAALARFEEAYNANKKEFFSDGVIPPFGSGNHDDGEQSFKEGEKKELADELADVLWVLICIANQTGVDLSEALMKNLDKKTKRDKERHINNKKLI